ncbi:MAG: YCF48-related protein, partial [Chloroflexota bacterium]
MQKTLAILASIVVMGLIIAGPWPGRAAPVSVVNNISAAANDSTQPDLPAVVNSLYFGFPAGNGYRPQQVAVDGQQRRLYTFNEGLAQTDAGNTISVLDLDTGEVTALLRLDNISPAAAFPPAPLDLQVDPYRPRLYALWGDALAGSSALTLTIFDTTDLTLVKTLPGIGAIAPGPEQLYLANETRLWAVDPDSLAELSAQELELRRFCRGLRLDPQAGRLYLGRGQPWSIEVFAAATLAPMSSRPVEEELIELRVDPARRRILTVYNRGGQTLLQALDQEGQPQPGQEPLVLAADMVYSRPPLALTAQALYWVEQDSRTYAYFLRRARLSDLTPQAGLPLANLPYDLAADPAGGQLYAAYSNPDSYLLAIDPDRGNTEIFYTALDLMDALADPDRNRLYVLTNRGDLQILNLSSYDEIERTSTGFNTAGSAAGDDNGQLALDPSRQRLYLSGDPIRVIDTNTLAVRAVPGLRGQLTPDPGGDRLYLTPPCRCRQEQCNTLILDTDTLTGSAAVFPPAEPASMPCVVRTALDSRNRLLYATIGNGVPGSNSGDYFAVFDIRPDPPQQLYSDWQISYGQFALDPEQGRAFVPRYRMDRSAIHRLDLQPGRTLTQTLELAGAQGRLTYDPTFDRLYAVSDNLLQIFDGDLALLAEITLPPGEFEPLTFDSQGQRLYLRTHEARLLVVATSGGRLEPPPPVVANPAQVYPQKLLIAAAGVRFRLDQGRLYRSEDEGRRWQLLGRGLPAHPVNDIALSPTYEQDHTLLAGLWNFGRGGGLYRSTDGGDAWRPTTRGLTDLEIQQIAYSPTFAQDQTIFVTTLHRGLHRSTDGGETWTSLAATYAGDSFDHMVSHLAVSPTFAGDGLLFIGHNKLLRSTDGGDAWVDTGLPPGLVAFSPDFADDAMVLSEGRWRSADRGLNWEPAAAGLEPARQAQAVFFSPQFAADQTVYLLLQHDFAPTASLQRSTDGGRTWESLLRGLPPGFELAAAGLLPNGELYLTAGNGQTQTFRPDALVWGRPPLDLTRLDLQALAVGPDGEVWVANSAAGVFKSTSGGRTWQETGFPARASDLFLAHLAVAGDGAVLAAVGTALERSLDGGQTWTYLGRLPAGLTITSLAVSPNFARDQVVLVGGNYSQNQLLRSADGGDTWQVVFDGQTVGGSSDLSLIAFSPNFGRDGRVFAWLQEGGLLRSTDGGQRWELLDGDQGRYFGQSLALDAAGERLYLGALDGRLLVSTDAGESWTDLSDNLPGRRIWSSALALAPDGALFLGSDVGIFRSRDKGQSWTAVSDGLPLEPFQNTPSSVRGLALDHNRLYATLTAGGIFFSEDEGE